MVKYILDLLKQDDYLATSKEVDIAKGLYEYPEGYKGHYKRNQRKGAWQK